MQRLFVSSLAFAILIGTSISALAADDTLEQIEEAMNEPLRSDQADLKGQKFPPLRLDVKEEIDWGDFDGTDVTMFRTSIGGEIRFPVTNNLAAAVSTRYGITSTNFKGDDDFIHAGRLSGDPWDELHDFSVRLRGLYSINDTWGLMFATWMTSRFEEGASFGDGIKGTGAVAVKYNIGKKFSVAAGLSLGSSVVGSGVNINPFGQLSWQITDVHTLQTYGLGLRMKSRWNKKVTTFVYGSRRGRRWRLEDRNDLPSGKYNRSVNKGSLRDRKVPIGIGVQWKFARGWRLRTDLGLTVYRQIKVTDDDNNEVDSDTMRAPGVFGKLMLQRRF